MGQSLTGTTAGGSRNSATSLPSSSCPRGLKDVSLVLQTAASSKVPMPLASLLHDHFLAAVAKGRGDLNWTGLAAEVSEGAGLRAPSSTESNTRTGPGT